MNKQLWNTGMGMKVLLAILSAMRTPSDCWMLRTKHVPLWGRITPHHVVHAAARSGGDISNSTSLRYSMGLGKNKPVSESQEKAVPADNTEAASKHWIAPLPVEKPESSIRPEMSMKPSTVAISPDEIVRTRKMVARDDESQQLRGAMWHEDHFVANNDQVDMPCRESAPVDFEDLDLSIPSSVYEDDGSVDLVWDMLRWEAEQESQREPLLVSFLHSTILNHKSLESSLAFLLANRLSSPAMISTQLQSLILEALECSPSFRRSLRADMVAVRDRDPACTGLPDVFLYFKGFHALQTHRVAHYFFQQKKQVLAQYLQSQVSQTFQIDIHPNATLGSGIMLDHGTGIVIGETATVGHNCSILHHVTLGGSGKKGVDRHPKVGAGVLLGAGASILGNVRIGDGCQVGAGTLVISDLPAHCVAVGVPAKVIGSFVDVTEQPSIGMNQMINDQNLTFESSGI